MSKQKWKGLENVFINILLFDNKKHIHRDCTRH